MPLIVPRDLPQRAVTLTTIIYWLSDLAIPIWEVTAKVTALITRVAVTGNMLYIYGLWLWPPDINLVFISIYS